METGGRTGLVYPSTEFVAKQEVVAAAMRYVATHWKDLNKQPQLLRFNYGLIDALMVGNYKTIPNMWGMSLVQVLIDFYAAREDYDVCVSLRDAGAWYIEKTSANKELMEATLKILL